MKIGSPSLTCAEIWWKLEPYGAQTAQKMLSRLKGRP